MGDRITNIEHQRSIQVIRKKYLAPDAKELNHTRTSKQYATQETSTTGGVVYGTAAS